MSERNPQLETRIVDHLKSSAYRPQKPRALARQLNLHADEHYGAFRQALRALRDQGIVAGGPGNTLRLAAPRAEQVAPAASPPTRHTAAPSDAALPAGIVIGTYRHNRRGFGFVVPTDPPDHEDLYIPLGEHAGAITGDIVRARVTGSERRDGRIRHEGRILEILERTNTRFAGSLVRQHGQWLVLPDGNEFTDPILAPDAGSRHIKPGTKVVIELTQYAHEGQRAQGVITEILGLPGAKDVDLRSVIVQYNLPGEFTGECRVQAREALNRFNATLQQELARRQDLSASVICTIDPDDAKDYDDAISLVRLDSGHWELGVHIADVAFFVEPGTPLDEESLNRGNSAYFPGHVIPMLPEVLSNGVCSLQEGVPRLCKSAFIELDAGARPVRTRFANTVIRSAQRLRYREAQAILDNQQTIPHPDGLRKLDDYPPRVIQLLRDMEHVARQIQKRRLAAGQLVLGLPEVDLVLDEEGKVTGAVPEDESYTHTIIEMFMVEANEAVARLLDGLDVPFLRRVHPEPEPDAADRLRAFVHVAGYKLPKVIDRKALQSLLTAVKDRPEAFAVNLAVLKSLARAEYSPQALGHYALASQHYCHFTSPIRRYADLMVHRLLDQYVRAGAQPPPGHQRDGHVSAPHRPRIELPEVVAYEDLVELGKHLSFTERRADDAENELRKVKLLELLQEHVGRQFRGVVTGVAKFGIFVQLQQYLIDGLVRYEDLLDDFWEVDERSGVVRGRRSGQRIAVGDLATVIIANVDVPRRELSLAIAQLHRGGRAHKALVAPAQRKSDGSPHAAQRRAHATGHRQPSPRPQHRRQGGVRRASPRGRR